MSGFQFPERSICSQKKVIREHRIPFEISSEDPFYSEENQKHLLKNIEDMKNGINCAEHELIEV